MSIPSLTIMTAVHPVMTDVGKFLLEREAKKLESLNPKTVLVKNILSKGQYNEFFLKSAIDYFDTDFVLNIEPDSKIIEPSALTEEFFKYDYVGAPWIMKDGTPLKLIDFLIKTFNIDVETKDPKRVLVGNGGFSLRSRKFCQTTHDLFQDYSCSPFGFRSYFCDVYACILKRDVLEEKGIVFAPFDVAKKFSVEKGNYEGQFGSHKYYFDSDGIIHILSAELQSEYFKAKKLS